MSSLRRGHANLLCIVPILTDDPRRESKSNGGPNSMVSARSTPNRPQLASPLPVSMLSVGMTSLPDMVRFSCFENLLCQVELFIRASACAHVDAWLSLCSCVGQDTTRAPTHPNTAQEQQHDACVRLLVVAQKQTTSREILLWMTPSEAPKALQASECSELLDPTGASCWIFAQR